MYTALYTVYRVFKGGLFINSHLLLDYFTVIFSWETAQWTQMSQQQLVAADAAAGVKKIG